MWYFKLKILKKTWGVIVNSRILADKSLFRGFSEDFSVFSAGWEGSPTGTAGKIPILIWISVVLDSGARGDRYSAVTNLRNSCRKIAFFWWKISHLGWLCRWQWWNSRCDDDFSLWSPSRLEGILRWVSILQWEMVESCWRMRILHVLQLVEKWEHSDFVFPQRILLVVCQIDVWWSFWCSRLSSRNGRGFPRGFSEEHEAWVPFWENWRKSVTKKWELWEWNARAAEYKKRGEVRLRAFFWETEVSTISL